MTIDLAHINAILTTTLTRWTNLLEAAPDELLTRRPAPAEWSAVECLIHIIDVEHEYHSRVEAFLASQDFPASDSDNQGTKFDPATTPKEIGEQFLKIRAENLKVVARVQPEDLDRQVRHGELGPVKLREQLNEWAAHDLIHTVQAEIAMMQPFILGCGPWKVFLADHLVEQN